MQLCAGYALVKWFLACLAKVVKVIQLETGIDMDMDLIEGTAKATVGQFQICTPDLSGLYPGLYLGLYLASAHCFSLLLGSLRQRFDTVHFTPLSRSFTPCSCRTS
jgi:hypothetical protein